MQGTLAKIAGVLAAVLVMDIWACFTTFVLIRNTDEFFKDWRWPLTWFILPAAVYLVSGIPYFLRPGSTKWLKLSRPILAGTIYVIYTIIERWHMEPPGEPPAPLWLVFARIFVVGVYFGLAYLMTFLGMLVEEKVSNYEWRPRLD